MWDFSIGGEGTPWLTIFLGQEDIEVGLGNRIVIEAKERGKIC